MQSLEVFQSLWAMSRIHSDHLNCEVASLPAQFELIAEAGFDGVDIVYGDFSIDQIQPLLEKHQLGCTVTTFPESETSLQPAIAMAKTLQARHLNIIGKVYPLAIGDGVQIIHRWLNECNLANIKVTIETHRDCITTDLHYTLQLMQAIPEMKLCADLSHFVVGREFSWPITPLVDSQIKSVLDQSIALQGRIGTREQIQVPIDFPQHRKWTEQFIEWWSYGISSWKRRAGKDDQLNFLCELGPPEYALTDSYGKELSNRWQEALWLKDQAHKLWQATSLQNQPQSR